MSAVKSYGPYDTLSLLRSVSLWNDQAKHTNGKNDRTQQVYKNIMLLLDNRVQSP